jgi:hypothetical protein
MRSETVFPRDEDFLEYIRSFVDECRLSAAAVDRLFAIARRGAEAADRIEQLEAALRPLACTCKAKHQAECSRSEVDCPFWTARAALEERT